MTQLARKAEAVLMVALTLQLVASVACGHGRQLLRGAHHPRPESTVATEVEPDFGLQHPGLASAQHLSRKARSMQAEREAEETFEDWHNLQDSYEAETRLHRHRLAVVASYAGNRLQPARQDKPHLPVVHRPLYIDAGVRTRVVDPVDVHQEASEPRNDLSHEGGQHTVDQAQDEEDSDPDARLINTEDIHSSEEVVSAIAAYSRSGAGRRQLPRRMLFVPLSSDQQLELQQLQQLHHGLTWPSRQLQRRALSSRFGPKGLFSDAVDPVGVSSASTP